MGPALVDTHAHLQDPRFAPDLEAVLHRARQAGVCAVVTCGACLASSRQAVELARRWHAGHPGQPAVYAAVGIHPHEAGGAGDVEAAMAELRELARQPGVVAVGEVGLDYHYQLAPPPVQRELLACQLEVASELGLPVILHSREAVDDVLDLWREFGRGTGVLHAFSGSLTQARRATGLGLYLGVGGMVTFKNAAPLREVLRQVELQHLVLETDAPYLAPVPLRGQRNEPSYLVHTANAVAQLLGLLPDEVAAATTAAARRLFGLAVA